MKLEKRKGIYYKSKIYQCINTLVFLSVLFLILPQKVSAQVLINEFSPKSPEWVEFYNKNNYEINLENYYFDDCP